jgi:prolyl-tRNA editing enzyme YbaK/EbsC (Cys-tRNA(Pro) deacylase)
VTDSLLHPLVAASLQRHGVEAQVLECLPELADTAAFCEHYGVPLEQAANTIVVASRKVDPPVYAACVVLGTTRLDVNTSVRALLGVK